jgi:hypothetical protein
VIVTTIRQLFLRNSMHGCVRWVLAFTVAVAAGCKSDEPAVTGRTVEFHRVSGKGVENFYLLGKNVYSGSAPDGEEGFATLEKLGVKTIISVDGSAPEVQLATKHGMTYVHLPIGYDGTSRSNALRIVKAAEVLPGPLFVHCHHGQHRGPTAAALVCEGLQGWSPAQAEAWLQTAGTATNYPGLYRMVRDFSAPTAQELRAVSSKFPSHAKTPGLVQTMVQVDAHFDMLKAFQKADFKPLPAHPDATATTESLMLWELLREAHRNGQGVERGDMFKTELLKAAGTAENLHSALKALAANSGGGTATADAAFQDMTKRCAACHKVFRN